MCGFFFIKSKNPINYKKINSNLTNIIKRGPDSFNQIKLDDCFFSHARLSIIDLQDLSNQPFVCSEKRYYLGYNGEIYNFKEIKNKLIRKGLKFFTDSDTEVLLNGYIFYGSKILNLLRGMFSFVIYDSKEKSFFAARDPYGIKPLYYYIDKNNIVFSSSFKSIVLTGYSKKIINHLGNEYFNIFGTFDENELPFSDIKSLKGGEHIKVNMYNDIKIKKNFSSVDYFQKEQFYEKNIDNLQEFLNFSLEESIKSHLCSDVPVGVLTSGGADSNAILRCLSKLNYNPLCITIDFNLSDSKIRNEIKNTNKIAQKLGFKISKKVISEKDIALSFPNFINDMDIPSIDAYNTWFASEACKASNLKVVLSGIGGDELFMGYKTFKIIPKIMFINNFFGNNIFLKLFYKFMSNIFNNNKISYLNYSKCIAYIWTIIRSDIDFFNNLRNQNTQRIEKVLDIFFKEFEDITIHNKMKISLFENEFYLKNQLLRDTDWASMSHGVEVRTPFVDFKLIKTLSPYILQLGKSNKNFLKKFLFRKDLDQFYQKTKTGFGFPKKNLYNNHYNYKDFIYSEWLKSLN